MFVWELSTKFLPFSSLQLEVQGIGTNTIVEHFRIENFLLHFLYQTIQYLVLLFIFILFPFSKHVKPRQLFSMISVSSAG